MRRVAIAVCLLISGLALTVACAEDDSPPEPTATPTPAPEATPTAAATATPAPAATPEPTPAATPEPEPPSEPFVFVEGTTGADLLSWLSEEEVDCIRGNIGDAGLAGLSATDLSPGGVDLSPPPGAAAAPPQESPVFSCFTRENIGAFGAGLYPLWVEGRRTDRDPAAVACLVDVLRANPEITYSLLRVQDPEPDTRIGAILIRQGFACLPAEVLEETVQSLLSAVLAGEPPTDGPAATPDPATVGEPFVFASGVTGTDLLGWLSEGEVGCIRENLGEQGVGILEAFDLSPGGAALSPQGLAQAAPIFACFTRENVGALGAGLYTAQSIINGQDPGIYTCIAELLRDRPGITYSLLQIPSAEPGEPFGQDLLNEALSCMPEEFVDGLAQAYLAGFLSQ